MKIICINGFPKSGKTAFSEYCTTCNLGIVQNISTIDFVKEIAKECGWNGEKDFKNRKFLSDLKDLLTEWNDVPVYKIKEKINKTLNLKYIYDIEDTDMIFLVHTREPKELKRFKDEFGARCLLITRKSVENEQQSNHADKEVNNFKYDYVIENEGSLEDLKKSAKNFIINILKENWKSNI